MTARLDHLVVVAHSLEAGSALVQAALGVAPSPGRRHPHMGTHNLLLSLGESIYLEVIAIDPDAQAVSRPRWFGLDSLARQSSARLAAWVVASDNIAADATAVLGEVQTMQREGRSWQMTITADGHLPLSGAAPLLIQRDAGPHPASRLPDLGLRLRELRIAHAAPAEVSVLLSGMALAAEPAVTVVAADATGLSARIDTPHGPKTLGQAEKR